MSRIEENDVEFENLESIVDGRGLTALLYALESICEAKADHLETNWQDKAAAPSWRKDGEKIGKLALKVEN